MLCPLKLPNSNSGNLNYDASFQSCHLKISPTQACDEDVIRDGNVTPPISIIV